MLGIERYRARRHWTEINEENKVVDQYWFDMAFSQTFLDQIIKGGDKAKSLDGGTLVTTTGSRPVWILWDEGVEVQEEYALP